MASSLAVIGVAALLAVLPAGCDEGCKDDLGCGPTVWVKFDPPITPDGETLIIEVAYDNQLLRCEARPEGDSCGPEFTANAGGYFQLTSAKPITLTVRVLRGDRLIAEETLTPAYRKYRQGEQDGCPRCEGAPIMTMHIPSTADGGN